MDKGLTYGVNIDIANATKKEMAEVLKTDKRVLNKFGAFASIFDLNFSNYKEPVLVLKTEEPGSKQLLAAQYGSLETVAYDMINHLINDCIVMGATPLAIQDAIICSKIVKEDINKIVKSIADACEKQGCVLTGGETSEQPGVISNGTYILTSSIVGIVEKSEVIDGSDIKEGDIVLGVSSSGIHTNGYTLVRTLIKEHPQILNEVINGKSFMNTILEPHRCYYNYVKNLFGTKMIHGMAHITGGGICENLNRILPDNVNAEINLSKYNILEIFKKIKTFGNVSDKEMLRTYNLGIGFVIVTDSKHSEDVKKHISKEGISCYEIGKIVKGNKQVVTIGNLNW
ncbi:MAG: phosphoribosylformylglycinamidine cyclo-ligase [Clostridia bacterium]|nr:phosphoribosylformylglycinamidine cyclo-ligase [Clostridia bacterium]